MNFPLFFIHIADILYSVMILPQHISLLEAEAIEHFCKRVREKFGDRVTAMRLFGSRARMEGHEWSDIDILVLIKDLKSPQDKSVIFTIAAEVYGENEVDISPLVMSPEEFDLLKAKERRLAIDIEKEGIPIE